MNDIDKILWGAVIVLLAASTVVNYNWMASRGMQTAALSAVLIGMFVAKVFVAGIGAAMSHQMSSRLRYIPPVALCYLFVMFAVRTPNQLLLA